MASLAVLILAPILLATASLLVLSGRDALRLMILVLAIVVAMLVEWQYWARSGNVSRSDLNEVLAFLALDGGYLLGTSVAGFWIF